MKTKFYSSRLPVVMVFLLLTMNAFPQVINGPITGCGGSTMNYFAPSGMTLYAWSIISGSDNNTGGGGRIISGAGTHSIKIEWTDSGVWIVTVTYNDQNNVTQTLDLQVTVTGPTITGPLDQVTGLPATIGNGVTTGQVYTTEPGMKFYKWNLSSAGKITDGIGTNSITVTWTDPAGQETVQVTYVDPATHCVGTALLIINYYPFLSDISLTDIAEIPQFVDPLPHFAAGLRVNAKAGGKLIIRTVPVQQVALSTGTELENGTIGDPSTPNAGKGNYAAYQIFDGVKWGPAMWPAQTIETQVGKGLQVQYQNNLTGMTYSNFNILSDQTLLENGYPQNGNIFTDPYNGPIPMVVHLHGGEMPSNSDGGPTAWFMPGYSLLGPGFTYNASSLATYPNRQEAGTLWYHPHDQGNTRTNVYTGLAGFYFLRGPDEEAAKVPGWSGDDKVREITPSGRTQTFNGSATYLPEIEIAIQDRMFNSNGELFWPVAATNPDKHPFWTPEFFGNVMVVNGKSWPYLSVAPRRYRFRILDGCNARFLSMWLQDLETGVTAPSINVIGSDGAFLDTPAVLNMTDGDSLFMAPGERYDVIIDFSNVPAGTTFTLMNKANAPYPNGDPVIPGLTDRIMQFVVNGEMAAAADPSLPGIDKSFLPATVRPINPMVKLTDFNGKLNTKPDVKRQIILNEVSGAGGPVQVLFNNSHFDTKSPIAGAPLEFGGPTETPVEGTTELISIINTTVDAHPIHVHLTQWQLVSRQKFNADAFLAAYSAAWSANNVPEFPSGQGYPGGGGSPKPYDTKNSDGAIGGNPAISEFLMETAQPAAPDEMVWKDDVKAFPGEVATFIVRYAPTDKPVNSPPDKLLYPFDPSLGPGYVWHCHIIDHEDMDMMRPLMIKPSPLRFPQITAQPKSSVACTGDVVTYSVTATSATTITYQWQISTDAGQTWKDLANDYTYSGSKTSSLKIKPEVLALNGNQYRCILTNVDGSTTSTEALQTVNTCNVSGTLKYNNADLDPLKDFIISINGLPAKTDASGAFTVKGVTSGNLRVTLIPNNSALGSSNSTDAGSVNSWLSSKVSILNVKYLAGDADYSKLITTADPQVIQSKFVNNIPFLFKPYVIWNAIGSGTVPPPDLTVNVNGQSVTGFDILGMSTGDFNGSWDPNNAAGSSNVTLSNTGKVLPISALSQSDVTIRSAGGLNVGAVSLIMNIPSDLVKITGVRIAGSSVPVSYAVNGNELRIGWNSTSPVNVSAEGDLLIVSLKPSSKFTQGKTMTISLVSNSLNELADGSFAPINNPELIVDNVQVVAANSVLELSAAPNPTSGRTTITFKIPENGKVTLGINNSRGIQVKSPFINNQYRTANTYTLDVNVSSLAQGSYYLTLKLQTNTSTLVKSIVLVKK